MRDLGWSISGIGLSVVLVLATGALRIQLIGQEAGAVFDLNNTVVGITSPRTPLLPMLATAMLNALAVLVITRGSRRMHRRSRLALAAGFTFASVLLITSSFFVGFPGDADSSGPLGVVEGWQGWLEKGGSSPAVHVVALLSLGSLWLLRVPRGRTVATTADSAPAEAGSTS